MFNAGYAASSGASLTRGEMSGEAIRLGRLLVELRPEPEAVGLLVVRALGSPRPGPCALQAAIAAVHAPAPTPAATDRDPIVALCDVLARVHPSPVIELNRAAALAMRDGPAAGWPSSTPSSSGASCATIRSPMRRADLCRRLGRSAEARVSSERALGLTRQEPERRFLERRLAELPD